MLRRVCIECEDTRIVTVTTYLQQKKVDLTKMVEDCTVLDLVSLRYLPSIAAGHTEFYLMANSNTLRGQPGTMKNPHFIVVCARVSKDSWGEIIGDFRVGKDKSKVFSVNIPG